MKKLIFLFLTFSLTTQAISQLGVSVIHIRPTGYFGTFIKPAFGGEVSYLTDFENPLRIRFSASLTPMRSRLDEYPTYVVENNNGTITLLPGVQSFNKYRLAYASVGADYSFTPDMDLSLYAGGDMILGYVRSEGTVFTSGFVDETFFINEILLGFRPRIGVDYPVSDRVALFGEVSRSWYMNFSQGFYSHNHNTYSIGFRIRKK